MKILIVEDDFNSRLLLQHLLKSYGPSHIAVNGAEAVKAVGQALNAGDPYLLICLDIMMPEMDGQTALKQIRSLEEANGVLSHHGSKVVMTTAMDDLQDVRRAYYSLCDGYVTKPIDRQKLLQELKKLELIA